MGPHRRPRARLLSEGRAALVLLIGCLGACASTPREASDTSTASVLVVPERAAEVPPPEPRCEVFTPEVEWPALAPPDGLSPVEVVLCPSAAQCEARLAARARYEPPLPVLPEGFEDALEVRGGLAIYERAIREASMLAWHAPVLYFHTPPMGQSQVDYFAANPGALKQARAIWSSPPRSMWRRVQALARGKDKVALRHTLLRDGAVFFEDPAVARVVFERLGLQHLFDEPEIFLRRGDAIHRLEQVRGGYAFSEGVDKGARAQLLIFDRVATSREALAGRQGWDLSRYRRRAALKALSLKSVSPDLLRIEAVLWSGQRLDAAIAVTEGGVHELALLVPPEQAEAVVGQLDRDRREMALMRGIVQAGEVMVREGLPFDEPRTEDGQQDGALRIMWRHAYANGANYYSFNGDFYSVFTGEGQPKVPQVCVDFVWDSVERWSGRWWSPKGEDRARTEGFLDVEALLGNRRQVRRMVEYAAENPDKVATLSRFEEGQRVPYMKREAFWSRIEGWSEDARPGDIVVIWGPRSDGRNHWHTFMIYDTDPVYNVPHLLIGNAGVARVTVWHDTMRTAPFRAITHRLRLRPEWLSALKGGQGG